MRLSHSIVSTCLALALFLSGSGEARAAILLTVDATDRANVVFAATGANSDVDFNQQGSSLRLLNFFTANTTNSGSAMSGNLRTNGGSTYTFTFGNNSTPNVVLSAGNVPHSFSTAAPAFLGQSTANLNIPTWSYRNENFIGDIRVYNSSGVDTGVTIGQYSLTVPEPTSLASLAVVFLAAATRRRPG